MAKAENITNVIEFPRPPAWKIPRRKGRKAIAQLTADDLADIGQLALMVRNVSEHLLERANTMHKRLTGTSLPIEIHGVI